MATRALQPASAARARSGPVTTRRSPPPPEPPRSGGVLQATGIPVHHRHPTVHCRGQPRWLPRRLPRVHGDPIMARYQGLDFYNIDAHLSEEERMVRDLVRTWTEDRVLPVIERHYQDGTFPMHLIEEIGEMGLLGMNLEGYGCAGMSNIAYGVACQELERGDSGHPLVCQRPGLAVRCSPSGSSGPRSRRTSTCPSMASAELIGCFGLTEPDHGSNPSGMMTRARRRRRQLRPQRRQDVDHQRRPWPTSPSSGPSSTGRDPRLHRRDQRRQGLHRARDDTASTACGPASPARWSRRRAASPRMRLLPNVVSGLRGSRSACLNNARFGISWGALGRGHGLLPLVQV